MVKPIQRYRTTTLVPVGFQIHPVYDTSNFHSFGDLMLLMVYLSGQFKYDNRRFVLRKFDHTSYVLNRPDHVECSIFTFRLVVWALKTWFDGRKCLEVRKLNLFPVNFSPGSVITLDALGNCVVDQVFQVFIVHNLD